MPDESGPLVSASQLVPSIYYDLIARVLAGAPFIILLVWTRKASFTELVSNAWIGLLLLLGASYLLGLVLTPFTIFWSALIGLPMRLITETLFSNDMTGATRKQDGYLLQIGRLRFRLSLNDDVAAINKEAGMTLAKMQAETTLSQNLLTGFVVLMTANAKGVFLCCASNRQVMAHQWFIFAALLLTAAFRTGAYCFRQHSFSKIYNGGRGPACAMQQVQEGASIQPLP